MDESKEPERRVLVLGGYGFIGSALIRALQRAGHAVTGLGRDLDQARRAVPGAAFVRGDLRDLQTPQDWADLIKGFDLVVNAAGQLQASDSELSRVQTQAIVALGRACAAAQVGVVQISAAGARLDSATAFMRSKAEADAALMQLAEQTAIWVLRPGLVLGQGAFGGTALLRMLAAVPLVQPLALRDAQIQCVGLEDLAQVVVEAAQGALPPGDYDLVEDVPHSLQEVLRQSRSWLGFAPARAVLALPAPLVGLTAGLADGLGRLGWRSPLRSTAMAVLQEGVAGDPEPYRRAMGRGLPALTQILGAMRAGREHRLEARMLLVMPFAVAILSLFWMASGVIAVFQQDAAALHLTAVGWSQGLAQACVLFWALVDIALALALLWRPWARRACLGMVTITLIYLCAASLVTPMMWLDPLGPLVKTLPGMMLALVAHQLLQER